MRHKIFHKEAEDQVVDINVWGKRFFVFQLTYPANDQKTLKVIKKLPNIFCHKK